AELSKTAIAPIRPELGGESADVDIAYAVQEVNTERALAEGRRLVGRKIGLTSKVFQMQRRPPRSTQAKTLFPNTKRYR
ncbi:hypothetical protein VXE63_23010, partial [Acinetobacter nosocomialis]